MDKATKDTHRFLLGLMVSGICLLNVSTSWAQVENESEPLVIAAKSSAVHGTASCFEIDRIEVSGTHDLIKASMLKDAIEPHAINCQSNGSVGEILKAINGLFAQEGYVTTQRYLPPQDIAATKALAIKIVPGRIGNVSYAQEREQAKWFFPHIFGKTERVAKAENAKERRQAIGALLDSLDDGCESWSLLPPQARLFTANSTTAGDVLHVDRVQDIVDGINKVPSGKAKAELLPGKEPATSDIKIVNKPDDAFRAYAGYDTESVEGVGRLRFGTTIEKDNLIGINDSWAMTLRSGTSTNDVSGNFSIPYNNLNFRSSGSWQESTTDLAGLAELFVTTLNVSAGVDWQVERTKDRKSIVDFTISHREQNRYISGIDLQDQRVSTASVGVSHMRSFDTASVSSRIGLVTGLPILNASLDPQKIEEGAPRAQFLKLEGNVSASYVVPGVASLSTLWAGQITPHVLYNDDKITMGSSSTVRGYANGSLAVDSGLYTRNEAAFALPKGLKPLADTWIGDDLTKINPYLFVDAGFGRDNANEFNGYRVSSGLGIRYGGPRASFNAGYAFRLLEDRHSSIDDSNGELFLNFRLKFL